MKKKLKNQNIRKKYQPSKIEAKWQKIWLRKGIYEPDLKRAKRPFYNLMMFPYPSAEGLHVGNVYAFTGADIYGRFQRMRGYDVFEPMGLDGFGIHSENYALKIGRHPASQAKISEKKFYKQLQAIGNGFAWREKLETYDPQYYRWTQWIFVQMFKRGLAYRKKAPVNWCPSCKTVLADEQVIAERCERCQTKVYEKELEQWFFRITKYAHRLLNNLEKLDWSERVKIAQKNWIGRSEGRLIKFKVKSYKLKVNDIEVFTTRPDTIGGVTFLVLSPQHPLASKAKNLKAINPYNKEALPIFVADYVLAEYGTGAIMGVPAYDERDLEFAKKHKLSVKKRPLVPKNKWPGEEKIMYRLRDWLISRQRYWGPPIPMIFCQKCHWQPVPEKDLPVLLPKVKNFRPTGTGKSPLANIKSFYETKCPACGGPARRETDVSDTFLDSAWYYFGYLMRFGNWTASWRLEIGNSALAKLMRHWLPVHMYIGGAEHSVLHLMYTRFLTMAFHDWGLIDFEEPFAKFRAHGLLISEGAKMSKSKGNIVNPDFYIKKFGADTLRMYLMFLAPFEQSGDFQDQGVIGIHRFLNRVWNLFRGRTPKQIKNNDLRGHYIGELLHRTIKKVTEDIADLQYNTAISALMILLRAMEKEGATAEDKKIFLKLLAPFAPHIAEELWQQLGEKFSIHRAPWPVWDKKLIEEEEFDLVIQINGKFRGTIKVRPGLSQKEAEKLARPLLKEGRAQRTIFVPDRLINFVI